jgi:hypothetical protein
VDGRHTCNGVWVAAWEARWLLPPPPSPWCGNGLASMMVECGGATRARRRGSIVDGRCHAGVGLGGLVASAAPTPL